MVLPATFRAASSGFYMGQEDIDWLDAISQDPDMPKDALFGSFQYFTALGPTAMTAYDYIFKGHSYGVDLGILQNLAESENRALEVIGDAAEKIGMQGFDVKEDIDWHLLAQLAADVGGVPMAFPYKLGEGINDYVKGKTDDRRALFGYSPSIRGASMRSPEYDEMHPHFEHEGGKFENFAQEMIDKEGVDWFMKNNKRLMKEYTMYDHFGGEDRHVNYLYSVAKNNEEKALYMYKLWNLSVRGERAPIMRYQGIGDYAGLEKLSPTEFRQRYNDWAGYGVISMDVVTRFETMKSKEYKKVFKD
jgi:hypothetical protein